MIGYASGVHGTSEILSKFFDSTKGTTTTSSFEGPYTIMISYLILAVGVVIMRHIEQMKETIYLSRNGHGHDIEFKSE